MSKKLAAVVLTASMLASCGQENPGAVVSGETSSQTHEESNVEKHESVKLPVTIYEDNDYNIEGQTFNYQRKITDVSLMDFDDSTELEFYDRYDSAVRNRGLDLQKDYKLLKINMKQETDEVPRSRPREAFMLNKGSGLVMGDQELASQDEFLMYQQEYLQRDSMVGKTYDETGDILMAIPKEIADDSNLQLRIKQELAEEKEYIYIDLN